MTSGAHVLPETPCVFWRPFSGASGRVRSSVLSPAVREFISLNTLVALSFAAPRRRAGDAVFLARLFQAVRAGSQPLN